MTKESLPSLGVWIETEHCIPIIKIDERSLPSLGVWIETYNLSLRDTNSIVTPFIGSVD